MAAIVLAGGKSSRMGVPKPGLLRDGIPLLRQVVAACSGEVIVVGPDELAELGLGAVRIVREDPPGGGPVAGIEAGLRVVTDDVVQLLACDLPQAGAIVAALDQADWPEGVDAVVPRASDGWPQFLAGRYRTDAVRRALAGTVRDVSVRRALQGITRCEVAIPDSLLADIDDPTQAAAAGWELPR